MADQQLPTTQVPGIPTTIPVVPTLMQKVTAKLKSLLSAPPAVYLAIVGVVVLLVAKFGSLFIDLLAKQSQKDTKEAQAQDAKLKTDEDSDRARADVLVQQADALPGQEQPTTEDWNKKK